jgi:predicted dehydrogenase
MTQALAGQAGQAERARLRVAIAGASGIGKHQAKWFALEGCEVAALLGSSLETAEQTRTVLRDSFGINARPYDDIRAMVAQERLDAISVCTPHRLHYEHTMTALKAGLHVLCEKPIVWDNARPENHLLHEARRMVEEARSAGKVLAVNTQYLAALQPYQEIYRRRWGDFFPLKSLYFEMESKGGRSGPNEHEEIWVDLASHPLSLLVALMPGSSVVWESLDCAVGRAHVACRFLARDASDNECQVIILLRNVTEGTPARRFGMNGRIVELAARNDARGIYRTYIRWNGAEEEHEDLVHTSIKRFISAAQGRGEPLAGAEAAVENLKLQLEILRRARRV